MLLEPLSQLILDKKRIKEPSQSTRNSAVSIQSPEISERYISYADWVQNPEVQWKGNHNFGGVTERKLAIIVEYLQSAIGQNDWANDDDDIDFETQQRHPPRQHHLRVPSDQAQALRRKIAKMHRDLQAKLQRLDTLDQEHFVLMWSLGLISMYLSEKPAVFSNTIIPHCSLRGDFCLLSYAQETLRVLCKKAKRKLLYIETIPVNDRSALAADVFAPICFHMTLCCLSLVLSRLSPAAQKYAMDIETYALNIYRRVLGNQAEGFGSEAVHTISEVLSYCGLQEMIPNSLKWHHWLVQENQKISEVLEFDFADLPRFDHKPNQRVLTRSGRIFYVLGRKKGAWNSNLFDERNESISFSDMGIRLFPAEQYPDQWTVISG